MKTLNRRTPAGRRKEATQPGPRVIAMAATPAVFHRLKVRADDAAEAQKAAAVALATHRTASAALDKELAAAGQAYGFDVSRVASYRLDDVALTLTLIEGEVPTKEPEKQ